jgi:hypothetical protein
MWTTWYLELLRNWPIPIDRDEPVYVHSSPTLTALVSVATIRTVLRTTDPPLRQLTTNSPTTSVTSIPALAVASSSTTQTRLTPAPTVPTVLVPS